LFQSTIPDAKLLIVSLKDTTALSIFVEFVLIQAIGPRVETGEPPISGRRISNSAARTGKRHVGGAPNETLLTKIDMLASGLCRIFRGGRIINVRSFHTQ